MRFSVRLNNDLPVRQTVALAQAAERAGFDQFWLSDDLFLRSATVMLAAIARDTEHIHIGSGIFNPYTLNPAQIAMNAATLDELSGGRFCLGLAAGAGEFLSWVGIEQERPLTAVVETIQVLRQLLAGERAPLDGHFLRWTDSAWLRFTPPRKDLPIYPRSHEPAHVAGHRRARGRRSAAALPAGTLRLGHVADQSGRRRGRPRPGGNRRGRLHLVLSRCGPRGCRAGPARQDRALWPRTKPDHSGTFGPCARRL